MKIAVVCANGRVGRLVVKEALNRGFDVTAVVRGQNKTEAKKAIIKDLFELTKDDLKGFDAVVDAFGAWSEETYPQYTTSIQHFCDILSGSDTRLLIVGGAGSLYLDKDHKKQLIDLPDFPDEYKPMATAMAKALVELRKRDDVNWTFISPAADF